MLNKRVLALCLSVSLLAVAGCDGTEEREIKYLNKAQAYFDEDNFDKMQVELKNVLQINPKNVEARYLMALAAEKDQDWRKMFGNLSAVVEAKPDHYAAQLKLGKLMLFSKENDKASEKVAMVLASQPNNAGALALKATIHLTKKEQAEAMILLNKALEAEPGHYDASLLLIKMLGDEKKLDQAKQVLENALAVHPDKLKLSLVKINILMAEDKKDEAEALFQSLVQKFPENENLSYSLAKLYIGRKKTDLAEDVLKNLVAQLPEKDQPKFVLIDFLTRQRGIETTEKELDILISENPDNFGFRFARLGLYRDQPEKIQQILEGIVEDDKLGASGINARNKLALLLNSKGDGGKTKELLEQVIELDARNTEALLFRSSILLKEKDFDGALADARTILRDNPESEKALMLQAVAQLNTNNVELAKQSLEKVLQVNPKNLSAIKDLARIQVAQKDETEAIKLLESAKAMFKDDQSISVMLIDLYGKNQQWAKAEDLAKGLLEGSDAKELPHYKLAQLYMGQQKFEDAAAEFRKILVTKPAAPDVLAGLVNSYLALKQEGKAEKLLDNALENSKDNPALLTMRAELHRQRKQLTDAERLFKKVVELKPQVELGYKNLASIYLIQKQLDQAIAVFQQGLQVLPENGNFLMQIAVLSTTAGDAEKAIDAYEKLLLIAPENLLAINNLAVLLVESGDKEAIKKAYGLIEPLKDSKHSAFLDTYGWTSYKNDKVDEALIALETVTQKADAIPEMHYHLGMIYIEKGRVEEAKLELEKAIADDAKFYGLDSAKEALQKLKGM